MFTRINLSYDSRTMIEKKGINLRDCRSVDLIDCFTIDTLLMYAIYIYIYPTLSLPILFIARVKANVDASHRLDEL